MPALSDCAADNARTRGEPLLRRVQRADACRPDRDRRGPGTRAAWVLGCARHAVAVARAHLRCLVAARGLEETEAMNMIASQMPAELKRARADFVIDDDGSFDDLERDVDALWSSLQRDAAGEETSTSLRPAARVS